MCRAGHVLGILTTCPGVRRSAAGDQCGEADKGPVVNGVVWHAKDFILQVRARGWKILNRTEI